MGIILDSLRDDFRLIDKVNRARVFSVAAPSETGKVEGPQALQWVDRDIVSYNII